MNRRQFFRLLGAGGGAAALGLKPKAAAVTGNGWSDVSYTCVPWKHYMDGDALLVHSDLADMRFCSDTNHDGRYWIPDPRPISKWSA